jgi:hypothetical protein
VSVLGEYAGWVTAGLAVVGSVIQAVASHSRLKAVQEADRELFKVQLQAETDARKAADLLSDEKIKGWAERLKLVQAEQDRTRDMAEKVGSLAQAVESLTERLAQGQDRNDERFEQIRAAIADGRGR